MHNYTVEKKKPEKSAHLRDVSAYEFKCNGYMWLGPWLIARLLEKSVSGGPTEFLDNLVCDIAALI